MSNQIKQFHFIFYFNCIYNLLIERNFNVATLLDLPDSGELHIIFDTFISHFLSKL